MAGFVDEAQLHARAGDGGNGCVSFRREAHVPKGGPDGGDGGHGGSVWLVVDPNVSSLLAFKDHPFRRADNGRAGQGKKKHGRSGVDIEVPVPMGTVVKDRDGEVLADLVHPGERWCAAHGGYGGHGNTKFLSNRRRVPDFAERGAAGEEHWYDLELKLMADVALVGFPNVGKSTLISRISAAKPKIADYPFTTLVPNLGVVRAGEGDFVVADIPGLIEGASDGKGLGHQFLRHIERARVLAVLVDLAPMAELTPDEQEAVLIEELRAFRPDLLDRPRLTVGSRIDLLDAVGSDDDAGDADVLDPQEWATTRARASIDDPTRGCVAVSAVTGDGLPGLVGALATMVDLARSELASDASFVVHRPAPEGVVVERLDEETWQVHGHHAERAVSLTDITTPEASAYIRHRLRSLGVDKALAKAGAADGHTVVIAAYEFTYVVDP